MKITEVSRENRRFFAIASLGTARWYWVVWPSLEELQASTTPLSHVAEGYEKTKAEAVEKALEVAGRYAAWIAAKYAKAYHCNTKAGAGWKGDGSGIAPSPAIPTLHEFLYRDVYNAATREWVSTPYRVVRRTEKYIYVEQQPYSPGDLTGSWLDDGHPTYRLDRQSLEREGYAFIPATAHLADQEEPLFFNHERRQQPGEQLPECLKLLHLSWPCTVEELQEAYRKLVKSAHPDGGGSHDKFIALQSAYEQALRLCR